MTKQIKQPHIPDLILEKYVHGELPEAQRLAIEKQVARSPQLAGRVENLRTGNEDFQGRLATDPFLRKLQVAQQAADKPKRIPIAGYSLAGAVLIAVIAVMIPKPGPDITEPAPFGTTEPGPKPATEPGGNSTPDPNKGITLKGDAGKIFLYREIESGKLAGVKNSTKLNGGDTLRIGYFSAKQKYGVIFSIDGSQQTTLHFPEKASDSTQLKLGKKVLLNFAYQLDNAPKFERFYFLTSDKEIPVGSVLSKAAGLAKSQNKVKSGKSIALKNIETSASIIVIK